MIAVLQTLVRWLVVAGLLSGLGAQDWRMVADLNQTGAEPVGQVPGVAVLGDFVYYAGQGPQGEELYRSSVRGTGPLAQLVADVRPGPRGSRPFAITVVGNLLLFAADDGQHGIELWRSDGSAKGTALVRDINPGLASSMWLTPSRRQPMGVLRGRVYFGASHPGSGRELWSSDGTVSGTGLVIDLTPGRTQHGFHSFLTLSRQLLFTTVLGGDDTLCCTDGSARGTRALAGLRPHGAGPAPATAQLTVAAEAFCGGLGGLHRIVIDASGQVVSSSLRYGALEHRPLAPMPGVGLPPRTGLMLSHGASLLYSDGRGFRAMGLQYGLFSYQQSGAFLAPEAYFIGFDLRRGNELWRSDGTPNGTGLLVDMRPGPLDAVAPSSTPQLVRSGQRFFFAADDGSSGDELWSSDGSKTGTRRGADLNPGLAHSHPRRLTPVGSGDLVFVADHPRHGVALWLARGTPLQVSLLDAGFVGRRQRTAGDHVRGLVEHASTVYFAADDGRHGSEPWRSDGSVGGTSMLRDIHSAGSGLHEPDLVGGSANGALVARRFGDELLFTAFEQGDRLGLWKTAGSPASTVKLVDLPKRTSRLGDSLCGVAVEHEFYLRAYDVTGQPGLWKTQGSAGSTRSVLGGFTPALLTRLGRQLVFSIGAPGAVVGVGVSDGTVAGTLPLALFRQPHSDPAYRLVRVGRRILFAGDGVLWSTDGTLAGTRQLAGIDPWALAGAADQLLFLSHDRQAGSTSVYLTDGRSLPVQLKRTSGAPLHLVADVAGFWFTIQRRAAIELWRSDGSVTGTRLVRSFADGPSAADRAELTGLTPIGARRAVFSVSFVEGFGAEVWSSDGSAAGTAVIADLNPGPGGSAPAEFVLAGGELYFVADADGTGDRRLHVMSMGASTAFYGPGAATSGHVARFFTTDPVRGGTMDLTLSDAPPNTPGVLLVGPPIRPATLLGRSAYLYVDLGRSALLSIQTDASGNLRIKGERVPMHPALQGFELVVQVGVGPSLDLSDAVYLMPY